MAGDAGAEDGDSDAAFQTAAAGKPTRTKPSRPVLPPLTSDEIAQLETNLKHPNVEAFLSLIAHSEGATYNSLLNGPHGQQNTFDDYSRYPGYDHPKGSASGRYQILRKTYDDLSPRLGVRDFSPHTQDLLAAQLLTQKGAMQPLLKGDLDAVLAAAAPTWRSLPSGRDQPGLRSTALCPV
jgi:muramidase (phage lysozyme)